MSFEEYTNKNIEEIFEILKTSKNGLSKKEVFVAQQKYGLNKETKKAKTKKCLLIKSK